MRRLPHLLGSFTVPAALVFLVVACLGDDPALTGSDDGGANSGDGSVSGGPCTPTSCGAHGTCESEKCKCEVAYQGASCGDCAEGFQDKDKDGTCEAACTPTACGPHTTCDDASGKVACTCATGYSGATEACAWTGGLLDPSFQNMPANAWTADRGAAIEPLAAGSQDPGWAIFSQAASCTTAGRVVQTVDMPAYSAAEPLALRVNGRSVCVGVDCGGKVQGIGVRLNGAFSRMPFTGSYEFQEQCLGERSFGGPLRVALQPLNLGCGDNDYTVYVDRAQIVPQPTCPALNTIPNADFEAASGWIALASSNGTAAIVDTDGVNGTHGGQLKTTAACESASLREAVSIPATSTANTALKVNYKSTSLAVTDVSLNGIFIGQLQPRTTFGSSTLCIPDWAKGSVQELRFMLNPEGQHTCGDAIVKSVTVDDLSWTTDATCAADAKLNDPGVERVETASTWRFVTDSQFGAGVSKTSDSGVAHTGSGAVKLEAFKACGAAYAATSITIPEPSGANGPALKFYYTRTNNANGQFSASTSSSSTMLNPAAGYTLATLCLDPKRAGQPDEVKFSVRILGTCSTASFVTEVAMIDDLEVTTDASCPAE